MADKERNLQNAVKNARSAFYSFKGKKRKEMRKEARRAARVSKKLKQHSQQTKHKVEKTIVTPDETQIPQKKRKRKRKKKTVSEDEDLSYDQAAYDAANKIDEKIISSLGKKLGGNRKKDKLSSIFKADGLDYILEVCEPFTGEDAKGFSSDEEYLASKSKKVKKVRKDPDAVELSAKSISNKLLFEDGNESDHNEETQGRGVDEQYDDDDDGGGGDAADDDDDDDDDGNSHDHEVEEDELDEVDEDCDEVDNDDDNDNDDEDINDKHLSGQCEDNDGEDSDENSDKEYFPGDIVHETANKSTKYVPPALRNQCTTSNDKQQLNEVRIKKKLKGMLNRVSDGTLTSILSEIETMYLNNSRNYMNKVLYKMISEACVSTITTPEKLVIQHMVITAALHIVIGSEIGAYFVQMLCERFSKLHGESPLYGEGKTCHNILLMLISLYNLKVVDSVLIYDLIRTCLTNFREQDIELIFLILKSCGPNLRKDDPAALKEVIVTVHTKASEYPSEDKSYVNFMLETINALKNNNTRKIPLYDCTIVEDARKCLKTVVQGKSKSSSDVRLKVSLEDMLNAEEKGRWWITGSAWSGRGPVDNNKASDVTSDEMGFSATVLKAAKKQRMNTTVRKQIFCVMVSSEDYIDAFERLLKLNLTEKQSREVVHVLVDCCLQEKTYNPFYAHLANKLCQFNKSNQVTFQYSFWDRFKTFTNMKKHNMSNLEQFLAHMIASKSLSLSVLKIISFAALDKVSIQFFSKFFTTFLLQYPVNTVKSAFHRISNVPKLSLLRQGIKLFLRQFVYSKRAKETTTEDVNNEKMKEIIDIVESAIDGCDYVPL